jgi:hypothetical protein
MDMRRVMGNRSLRYAMWEYVRKVWQQCVFVPPSGCLLVYDYALEGAYCYDRSGWWLQHTPSNRFGESDLKIPFWMTHLLGTGLDFTVNSIDSDMMPILMHWFQTVGGALRGKVILR